MDVSNEEDLQQLEVQCRGACAAIQQLVLHFGDQVFLRIPKLEELSFRALQSPGVDRIPDIFLVSHWQICVTWFRDVVCHWWKRLLYYSAWVRLKFPHYGKLYKLIFFLLFSLYYGRLTLIILGWVK